MRIVFWGTPEFAIPSLRAMVGEGFDVVAVVTQPDRPRGRSRSSSLPPPVKVVALEEGIPVLQPESPSTTEFLSELASFEHEIGVVAAYGHILRKEILDLAPRGMVNVHASLLPKLRGAAPIEHAILEGYQKTGITIMHMETKMDAGPIIHQVTTPIPPDETGGELTVRLAELGALALVEGLALLDTGAAALKHQDHTQATYAPKITRALARIRWEEPAARIARQVRAFDPRPGSWTTLRGKEIKLFGPRLADEYVEGDTPGMVVKTDPALVIATADGALQFLDVQPSGKARMGAAEWIRGRSIKVGDRFDTPS